MVLLSEPVLSARGGIKAVDVIAAAAATTWFIEVKDYRTHTRTKPSDLSQEVADKVFDSLAALLPASINANDARERSVAKKLLGASRLRVVLHIEQPRKHSRLRPRAIDPANVLQKLRSLVKGIDPHPIVADRTAMGGCDWKVS